MTHPSWQPARTRSARRGVTLIELLVGTVITSLILSAVGIAVIAVQRSYVMESQVKGAVESGRGGMAFLERTVRLAGYGIDPRHAFSFSGTGIPSSAKDNHIMTLGITPAPPTPQQVVTDDLAFRYRDPAFMRRGSISGTSLSLQSAFKVTLRAGQPLLVSCHGGQEYVVVTLASAITDPNATTANVISYGAPFPILTSQDCLTRNGGDAPYVMLLHEVRVRLLDLGGRSFLVAYRDFAPVVNNNNYVTLAHDVESFQVAYVMNRPRVGSSVTPVPTAVDSTSTPANWVLGDAGSTAADAFPDTTAQAPVYATPYDDALRYNRHPANIRSVRLSIALRSSDREATGRQLFGRIPLENSTPANTVPDGFYRTSLTSAVRVPNMLSRSFFNPPIRPDATSSLNHNGG